MEIWRNGEVQSCPVLSEIGVNMLSVRPVTEVYSSISTRRTRNIFDDDKEYYRKIWTNRRHAEDLRKAGKAADGFYPD